MLKREFEVVPFASSEEVIRDAAFAADKVALSNSLYAKLFGTTLANHAEGKPWLRGVVEVTTEIDGKKRTIRRLFRGGNVDRITEKTIGLSDQSIIELGVKYRESQVFELRGSVSNLPHWRNRLLLYWYHPVDSTRVSFKLGLVGVALGAMSVVNVTSFLEWLAQQVLEAFNGGLMPLLVQVSPSAWSIIGLALNLAGVIVLFRYAMPYRTRSQEAAYGLPDASDPTAITNDRKYERLSLIGVALVFFGTAFQIAGAWLGP